MAPQRQINWQKLAEIYELKEFFAADFAGFQAEIEQQLQDLDRFPTETLDKLAKLRALEVTNGITQWAYRRGAAQALPIEQTRQCMNMVMGFMKMWNCRFPVSAPLNLAIGKQTMCAACGDFILMRLK